MSLGVIFISLTKGKKYEYNKFIELNNLIYEPDYDNINILDIYKQGIRKGYHIIETEVVLTKDNSTVIYRGNNNIYGQDFIKFSDLLLLCKENEIILDIYKTNNRRN